MQEPATSAKPGFDVVVKFIEDDKGVLKMTAHYQGETFNPQQIQTHCALDLLGKHWPDMLAQINGQFTDADRFRGLLEFSMLGQAEATKDRFETINGMLQQYEEKRGFKDGARTPEEFREVANFIVQSLIETEPANAELLAPTVDPE